MFDFEGVQSLGAITGNVMYLEKESGLESNGVIDFSNLKQSVASCG